MTFVELKNHQVWHDFTEVLENIDANALIKEHLELCDYKVCGYWDESDNYYEEITLPSNLETELISSSIGLNRNQKFIQLKFILQNLINNNHVRIGELSLIYDENLEFINENWYIDTEFLEKFK
ncbi:hypothetical protein Riv7116_6003 [Rivularia sp. PCC 7116]|uniref:hypothetical protein n=1 Tax=Rivularia sp. PCC 7116 TaxID=373994 RepID=UPI00029EEB81|nr:hypothetical protein [Rivularia sp. PCC 7116]AFY58364.1 hypothetical protein Riv7116_6003 [Rivularia sp. PCC 7116]